MKPLPESEVWLDSLNDELPYVRLEKDNFQINKTCARARELLATLNASDPQSVHQALEMVKEMHSLDRIATTWRDSPVWAYRTVHRSEIFQDKQQTEVAPQLLLTEYVQLHRDVWMAYEWNYHRTARILLHEQLVRYIDSLLNSWALNLPDDLEAMRTTSIEIVRTLTDEIMETVPQMLGDIDHEGKIQQQDDNSALGGGVASLCKGVGGYFLLWPIKITKSTASATEWQHTLAQTVFERIRECTGMKSCLGERSCI